MRSTDEIMQAAASDLRSYLTHTLEDFHGARHDVALEGPGRTLYLIQINEIEAALQALEFLEAVVQHKPFVELLPLVNQLQASLSTWSGRLSEYHGQSR